MFIRIGAVIGATSLVIAPGVIAQPAPLPSHRLLLEQVITANAVGDVDEGGHLDIPTAAEGSPVLLGHDDGTFTSLPIAGVPRGEDRTVADVDGGTRVRRPA